MSGATDARRDILRAIRANLAASATHDARSAEHATRATLPLFGQSRPKVAPEAMTRVARFQEQLAAVGGRCFVARSERAAAEALATIVRESGARRVAGSGASIVRELLAGQEALDVHNLSREALFDCDLGVTTAQWGIAESGTLVLEHGGDDGSESEKSRLLSLVPPAHVAILRTDAICDTLGDVLARLHAGAARPSRAVTFVTGPSRTSDIELTLTIGVHGPKALSVILLGGET